jgi:dipeptidase
MPAKLDRCVKAVKDQGKSEDSAYAICVKSTGIKRKKGGGWTKGKENIFRKAIQEVLKEVIQEQAKHGYVVAAVDTSKQGDMPGTEDNIHILELFPFSKYPEHEALEKAIEYASQQQANVYTMRPDGTYGEIVWPEKDLNEQDQEMVNILKGADYATINGLAYHLKECGCNTTMGYKNGQHVLMVRRDFLPLAVDSLKNTCDRLGNLLGEKLEQKHFKK